VIYRDHNEACPRCGVDLVDAGSVRACERCRGMWLAADVLAEMVNAMQPEARWVDLDFEPDTRSPIACPSCSKPMATWLLLGVEVDRCDSHGIWFDADELEEVLRDSVEPVGPSVEPVFAWREPRKREATALALTAIRRRQVDRTHDTTHVDSMVRDEMPKPDEPD
jgi:Zn-finger nucleic acid-binding protein